MPAQKGAINDKQVAQVMTYVRYKFGNISDTVVTKEMIEVARQKFGDKPNQYTGELSGEDVKFEGEQPRLFLNLMKLRRMRLRKTRLLYQMKPTNLIHNFILTIN